MTIIDLTGDDLERFLAIRRDAVTIGADGFRVSADDDERLGRDHWRQRLERERVVAIEREGRLVAVGGIGRMVGDKLDHKALVWGMFVAPEARGEGAGDRILAALLERIPDGVRQVVLTLVADNRGARRLYQRHGFELYAIEPQSLRIGDRFVDEALMWKPLG